MASELEKLGKTFRRSWMNSAECVRFLDVERLRRQNALVLGIPNPTASTDGWRVDHGSFAFADLVALVRPGASGAGAETGSASVLAVVAGCALIAELLAAVCNEDRRAGGVFDKSHDAHRASKQAVLLALRNAVCHPGFLPQPVNDESHVDALVALLDDEKNAFKHDLVRDRRHLGGPAVARWAVASVDDLGRFEMGRAIVAYLERRHLSVTAQVARKIERRSVDSRALPWMLQRLDTVAQADEIVAS